MYLKYFTKNILSFSKTWCLIICTVLVSTATYAQDPIFSLQQTSSMNYNPAHVGNTDFSRAIIGYRNQYPAFSSAFTTYSASFDTYFGAINSGVGIAIMHDKMAKIFNETTISVAYSYNLRISDEAFLRAGLQASLRLQSQDPSSLIFPDMINSSGSIIPNPFPYNSWNSNSFDVGAGLAFMAGPLKVGIGAFNFSGKKQNSYNGIELPNPFRLNAYASYDIMLVEGSDQANYTLDFSQLSISPGIQYQQQYDYQIITIGAFFKAGPLFIGLHERQDIEFESFAITLSAGIEFQRFTLGLSGDISQLGNPSNAIKTSAFEANLSIKLWENKEHTFSGRSPRYGNGSRGYIKSSGGIRVDNPGLDKSRVRRYRCPY